MMRRRSHVKWVVGLLAVLGMVFILAGTGRADAADTVTWTFKGNGKTLTTTSGVSGEELGPVTKQEEVVRTIPKGTETNVMISWDWPSCGEYYATYWKRQSDGKLFKHWEKLTADQDEVFLAEWHRKCTVSYELKKGMCTLAMDDAGNDLPVYEDPYDHAEGTELLVFESPVISGSPAPFYLKGSEAQPAEILNEDGSPKKGTGFLGWRVKGSTDGKIYNSLESYVPTGDTVFEAIFLPHAKGTVLYDGKGFVYKVTSAGKTVSCQGYRGTAKKVTIPDTVKLDTVKYKVTAVGANAFKGNTKLKTVVIGKNVTSVGKKAFYGCKKLTSLTIKSTKWTSKSVGAKAFTGTPAGIRVTVPKKQRKAYKALLMKKGISAKAVFS